MGIEEKAIESYAAAVGVKAGEHTSIWATHMPSMFNKMVFGTASILFDMRYNIANFTDEGVFLIAVDGATGAMRPEHIYIPKKDIIAIELKKKMTSMQLSIKTEDGELIYRVNGTMIGSKWHKANLPNVVEWINRMH